MGIKPSWSTLPLAENISPDGLASRLQTPLAVEARPSTLASAPCSILSQFSGIISPAASPPSFPSSMEETARVSTCVPSVWASGLLGSATASSGATASVSAAFEGCSTPEAAELWKILSDIIGGATSVGLFCSADPGATTTVTACTGVSATVAAAAVVATASNLSLLEAAVSVAASCVPSVAGSGCSFPVLLKCSSPADAAADSTFSAASHSQLASPLSAVWSTSACALFAGPASSLEVADWDG
mmetsp:Transcript_92026/g.177371  ORF Transcript_92026/g.177371 Transcript_92026/m.177371 type:complete len:244 (-) Transcript_92026:265-996(-)